MAPKKAPSVAEQLENELKRNRELTRTLYTLRGEAPPNEHRWRRLFRRLQRIRGRVFSCPFQLARTYDGRCMALGGPPAAGAQCALFPTVIAAPSSCLPDCLLAATTTPTWTSLIPSRDHALGKCIRRWRASTACSRACRSALRRVASSRASSPRACVRRRQRAALETQGPRCFSPSFSRFPVCVLRRSFGPQGTR
jgi:hypothetical protein